MRARAREEVRETASESLNRPPCAFQPMTVGSEICAHCGHSRAEHASPAEIADNLFTKPCYCGSGLAAGLCTRCWPL